jgi:two-component system, cell cycle response regulator
VKVIVAEDDPVTLMLINDKLTKWGYQVIEAENGARVLQLIEEHPDVQLFLVDWQMPELDGISLCIHLKNKKSIEASYIIILTSKKSTENLVLALESGADDFISKPFAPDELKVRLKAGMRVINTENQLLHQATHDPLTNVLNHRAIIDELAKLWALSNRKKSPLALLMLDLDHFKKVNDSYGHQAGDYALKNFCQLVKKELRPYDYFGRYGGEEFTICLPSADADQAMAVAERIRSRLESKSLEYDGLCFSITVSIGVALYSENQKSQKELLMSADKAAYEAKSLGRNQVVLHRD